MMNVRQRSVLLSVALAAIVTAPILAQTPTPKRDTPSPTPRIEQRFEKPVSEPARIRVVSLAETEQTFFYARPIVRVGQDYTLKAGDTVRHVRSVLADVRIDGHVERDVVIVMGNATVSATAEIEGSLVVIGGSATVIPGAKVRRDFVVVGGTAETPPDFSPEGDHVVVGTPMIGSSLRTVVPWLTRGLLMGRLIVPNLAWVWAIVGIGFLIGFIMNHIFDPQVASTAASLGRRPITAFFMGLLVLVLAGPILAIIAASVIGLAVVPFAIAAMIVATMIGKIGVARAIGRSVASVDDPETRLQSWRSFVLGFAVITIAYMIPVIGLLTWALVGVFGLGSATMSFAATLRRERPAPAPKAPVEPPPATPTPDFSPRFAPPPAAPMPPAASAFVAAEPPVIPLVDGQAPPAAAAPGFSGDAALFPRASFLDRLAAFALDVVLIAIVNAVMRYPWGDDGGFLVIVLAYQIAFLAWKGTTLGGIICNLRVVRTNGADLRFVDALVRGLSSIFSIAALGIGCLWMLNDTERQTWHDKIAGTVVVKVPRELVLA